MQVLIFIYLLMLVMGYPLLYVASVGDDGICFSNGVFLSIFVISLAVNIPNALFASLQNPFDKDGDQINVDNLLASTDLCLFQNMRALWHLEGDHRNSSSIVAKQDSLNEKIKSRRKSRRESLTKSTKGMYGDLL